MCAASGTRARTTLRGSIYISGRSGRGRCGSANGGARAARIRTKAGLGFEATIAPKTPHKQPCDKICYSPAFIGTQPRAIQLSGNEIVVMEKEVSLAFDFIASLTDAQRKDALKDERRGRIVAGAGKDGVRPDPRGLDCRKLTGDQRAILMELIHIWVGDLPEKQADARMKEIAAQLDDCRFAWRGPFEPGSDASYHLYGPGLILEFGGQDLGGDPAEHLHSIYRDPTNEYGARWLK